MNNHDLLNQFKKIVGSKYVLNGAKNTERFRRGWRSGIGDAICVIQPGSLLEQWKILKECIAANKIIIMQAANTGLTEGSTPNGTYDRDVVIINTRRMDKIYILNNGHQTLCMPGSTLFSLENLLKPLGRQPHSVLGSSCIGSSVVGGVCNNSGGALIERGPSYTQLSIFAKITEKGELKLINNLGIDLGSDPETILSRLESGDFSLTQENPTNRKGSDTEYINIVRDIDAITPARFNADPRCLYESAGCAGKLAVFAVRLDTYPQNKIQKIFYIGTNNTKDLTEIRKNILSNFKKLPVSGEYMHRDLFDISERYGKDTVMMINFFGTKKLPIIFAIKGAIDSRLNKIPGFKNFIDRCLQFFTNLWPRILPKRLMEYRDKYEHHLILKMYDEGIGEAITFLTKFFSNRDGSFFACNEKEGKMAELNRFAAAGATARFPKIKSKIAEDVMALDFSLRRNDEKWYENLPEKINEKLIHKLYYGHFFCYVMHQDYIFKKGVNVPEVKKEILKILDQRGAEYPAEHNVGHMYLAKPSLSSFYKKIDPTNSFNPGIGKMSKNKNYF
jgi:D-lactate dehydrogenase (quinone)